MLTVACCHVRGPCPRDERGVKDHCPQDERDARDVLVM